LDNFLFFMCFKLKLDTIFQGDNYIDNKFSFEINWKVAVLNLWYRFPTMERIFEISVPQYNIQFY
jgi:hypothetical protein